MKVLPGWYSIIVMAEQYGKLPWEIADDGNEALWFLRARVVNAVRAEVQNKKGKRK